MIFDGFANVTSPLNSVKPRAYDYMSPTLSKLAKTPADIAYHLTATKQLAAHLAD
jgi:hypothetical protein